MKASSIEPRIWPRHLAENRTCRSLDLGRLDVVEACASYALDGRLEHSAIRLFAEGVELRL